MKRYYVDWSTIGNTSNEYHGFESRTEADEYARNINRTFKNNLSHLRKYQLFRLVNENGYSDSIKFEYGMTALKGVRIHRQLTQTQLSELSGVPIVMIQKYEARIKDINRAQVTTVLKLADALKVDIHYLIEEAAD